MIYFSVLCLLSALVLTVISIVDLSKSMKIDNFEERIAKLEKDKDSEHYLAEELWELKKIIRLIEKEEFIDKVIERINRKQIR